MAVEYLLSQSGKGDLLPEETEHGNVLPEINKYEAAIEEDVDATLCLSEDINTDDFGVFLYLAQEKI